MINEVIEVYQWTRKWNETHSQLKLMLHFGLAGPVKWVHNSAPEYVGRDVACTCVKEQQQSFVLRVCAECLQSLLGGANRVSMPVFMQHQVPSLKVAFQPVLAECGWPAITSQWITLLVTVVFIAQFCSASLLIFLMCKRSQKAFRLWAPALPCFTILSYTLIYYFL